MLQIYLILIHNTPEAW